MILYHAERLTKAYKRETGIPPKRNKTGSPKGEREPPLQHYIFQRISTFSLVA